jgi:hypothetical protein
MGWDSDKSLKSETPIWPYLHTYSSDYKQARKILAYTVKKAVELLDVPLTWAGIGINH